MTILQLTTKIPYPLNDGGKIGVYNITKHLALLGHQVTLAAFTSGDGEDAGDLPRYTRLETMVHDRKNTSLGAFRALGLPTPYTVGKYHTESMTRRIDRLLQDSSYDLIHVDHLHMAEYAVRAKEKFGIPIFLREHNFETAIWERFSSATRNPVLKWFGKIQLEKMRRYEPLMAEKFNCCLMATREDETKLRDASSRVKTVVVPAGVDLTYFEPQSRNSEETNSLLFLGSLEWLPNQESFFWFYEEIFPRILSRIPSARLYVVGKNPSRKLRRLSGSNVDIVGSVDDIRPFMERAAVCVVPLRIGSGIRIKILEMLAMRKAVVTTSIGCEGIEVENGRHLVVADGEDAFAEETCRLLRDGELRRSLGESGRSLVCEHYQWEKVVQKLVSVYEETLREIKELAPI
jgi:sugar transferase (PEP-CTERM/EpsH1 system associated)